MKLVNLYRKYCLHEYEKIRKNSDTKRQRQFKYILYAPILIFLAIVRFIYENSIGRIVTKCRWKLDKKKKYKDELSIAAIIKNEAPYIREWIEYYRIVGVTRFYLYDNDSDDNLVEMLQPYISNGVVVYTFYPGHARQLEAYNDAIMKCKYSSRYLLCVDIDEFAVSLHSDFNLQKTISMLFSNQNYVSGIAINWCVYGSSGYYKKPEGFVTENYIYRSEETHEINDSVKVVCNPRLVKGYCFDPHTPVSKPGCNIMNVQGEKTRNRPWNKNVYNRFQYIRINHYLCKSAEEFAKKKSRGLATSDTYEQYQDDVFVTGDRNEVFDDVMLRYVEKIRENINNLCIKEVAQND